MSCRFKKSTNILTLSPSIHIPHKFINAILLLFLFRLEFFPALLEFCFPLNSLFFFCFPLKSAIASPADFPSAA